MNNEPAPALTHKQSLLQCAKCLTRLWDQEPILVSKTYASVMENINSDKLATENRIIAYLVEVGYTVLSELWKALEANSCYSIHQFAERLDTLSAPLPPLSSNLDVTGEPNPKETTNNDLTI